MKTLFKMEVYKKWSFYEEKVALALPIPWEKVAFLSSETFPWVGVGERVKK